MVRLVARASVLGLFGCLILAVVPSGTATDERTEQGQINIGHDNWCHYLVEVDCERCQDSWDPPCRCLLFINWDPDVCVSGLVRANVPLRGMIP